MSAAGERQRAKARRAAPPGDCARADNERVQIGGSAEARMSTRPTTYGVYVRDRAGARGMTAYEQHLHNDVIER